jgi:O-antigen biosynthesis protein WbqP
MKTTAPRECATSVLQNPEQHLTRVGKVIRKLSLDELPQLWCVLVGNMSFIGYRPLILNEVKCNEMRKQLGVFSAKPGISGYAQVVGRDDVYYKNKAILDAEYVKNASLGLDIKLFFQTFTVVLKKKGNRDGKNC